MEDLDLIWEEEEFFGADMEADAGDQNEGLFPMENSAISSSDLDMVMVMTGDGE